MLCAAGAAPVAAQIRLQPDDWSADLRLPEPADLNPDPRIVEIALDAVKADVEIAGTRVPVWTYNGGLPGPLIRARVGDRLIVHFRNRLPEPTTVHWHGLRVPIHMDGVPGASQPDVEPGGSFTYDFIVPDAGLFWYHPHVMSAKQVGFGLYGPLLVEDPDERVGVDDELVLVLSDIELRDDGQLESPDTGGSTGMLFGREGNHLLVNGRTAPRVLARSGAPQRWRIVNAAKSRYFQLLVEGVTFTQIGGDGGLQESLVTTDRLVVAAGERADVIVTPTGEPGTELPVISVRFNRGYGSVEARNPLEPLFTLVFADLPPSTGPPVAPITRRIEPLNTTGATPIEVVMRAEQLPDREFKYHFTTSGSSRNNPVPARPGETQIWTVINTTKWSHPFHLHGFFFQVLDEQGTPVRPLAWKDTVDVPFEKTVRLVVRFDDRAGSWMYHCHILDHADGGLMGTVDVGTPTSDHEHEVVGAASLHRTHGPRSGSHGAGEAIP